MVSSRQTAGVLKPAGQEQHQAAAELVIPPLAGRGAQTAGALPATARATVLVADAVLLSGWLVFWISRHEWTDPQVARILPLAVVPWALFALSVVGAYQVLREPGAFRWIRRSVAGLLLTIGGLLIAAYLFKFSTWLPRLVIGPWMVSTVLSLIGTRLLAMRWHQARLRAGIGLERLIMVGDVEPCRRLSEHLATHPALGMVPVARCGDDSGDLGMPSHPLAALMQTVDAVQAERVVVCGSLDRHPDLSVVLGQLMERAIAVDFALDLTGLPVFCLHTTDLRGQPLIHLTGSPLNERQRLTKALEDQILGWLILALITLPMLIIALVIRCTGPGPVLFRHLRHGLGGRTFHVFKFRTMQVNAKGSGQTGSHFRPAVHDDARITGFGRLLRNTSLDELPQFLNVVRGEMSIVGPRPHAVRQNESYCDDIGELMRRHYVKPGITGLAQINGARGEMRSSEDMRRRVALDLEYIRTWSLWLDLRIIAHTAIAGWINRQP